MDETNAKDADAGEIESTTNETPVDVDKKIRDYCMEMSASFTRAEGEREFRREATNRLAEQLHMEKSDLDFCAKTFHKGNFDEASQRMADQRNLYVRIFGEPTGDTEDDDMADLD